MEAGEDGEKEIFGGGGGIRRPRETAEEGRSRVLIRPAMRESRQGTKGEVLHHAPLRRDANLLERNGLNRFQPPFPPSKPSYVSPLFETAVPAVRGGRAEHGRIGRPAKFPPFSCRPSPPPFFCKINLWVFLPSL
ncbi:hypothetical protein HPP92_026788 [Vanilla planifolia]|uniref:Uncharacterized protein n=1 Tax=Vanilla planifolia TaxID=51239 RepID=A0A835UV23_VANPL|nr:hypothetical protein HPP92_026788 [Vanilla planifolia]KAG0473530.1 hypothetical protein HPP92_015387 [Vanilla planifolia]